MNSLKLRIIAIVFLVSLVFSVLIFSSEKWGFSDAENKQVRASLQRAIRDHEQLRASLYSTEILNGAPSPLGAYLKGIRADGIAAHTQRKAQLDRFARSLIEIQTLLDLYVSLENSESVKDADSEFDRYATIWIDRYSTIMDRYMQGGDYPVSEAGYPKEYIDSLEL